MECWNGLSSSDLFYGEAEGGDLGPLAAWGVDEFDRTAIRSELVFGFPAAGANGWYPPASSEAVPFGSDAGGPGGGVPRSQSRCVAAHDCSATEAGTIDDQSRGAP